MSNRKPVTLHRLREMHAAGDKIAMLTCYDALFARTLDEAGVDVLLVGDSLGNVLQGHATTLSVPLTDMIYHTQCVARGNRTAWLIADMPFGTYRDSTESALRHAIALMQAGAQMVKIEGGGWTVPLVRSLVERGIPVCGHLGFTPQSLHALGGYRIQAREADAAGELRRDAKEIVEAGAAMIVLEMIPAAVTRGLAAELPVPLIGIGAGVGCGGQVLVLHDMLGLTHGKPARFVRNFLEGNASIADAVRAYVSDVKTGCFPDDALHGY